MWTIDRVEAPETVGLWCSDGKPVIGTPRGGPAPVSYRLMVQHRGFIDITMFTTDQTIIDVNGTRIHLGNNLTSASKIIHLSLVVHDQTSFSVMLPSDLPFQAKGANEEVRASFKPFPHICPLDTSYMNHLITSNYVPYQTKPGKTDQEIRKLGLRLFPWTPHSYQLAMAIFDWTTASFARLVFFKIFEYTSLPGKQLDLFSIAHMIWESNWGSFTPSNEAYMNSFMMKPASSLEQVREQLYEVKDRLHQLTEIENALLSAALYSLPRTCTLSQPHLLSGQPDISQMGFGRFCAEFLEFPGNCDTRRPLEGDFQEALETYMSPGSIITIKMPWSFTHCMNIAMSYSNGILLVAEPEPGAVVWDTAAYVTDLSDEDDKIEYVFSPGAKFRIMEVVRGAEMMRIRLQVHRDRGNLDVSKELPPREAGSDLGIEKWEHGKLFLGESSALDL